MLLRMKVLLAACLCIVPSAARPSGGTSSSIASVHAADPKPSALPTSSLLATSNNDKSKREAAARWRPMGHARSHSVFRVIPDAPKSTSTETPSEMSAIPARTRALFTPPDATTKEARQLEYFGNSPEISIPPQAHYLLNEVPFFDTIDHGRLVTALQKRRKYTKLSPLVLKSIRPYFPFFSYE